MATETPRALASLEKLGMKVNPIGDVATFRAQVKPVYDKARAAGQGALLDQILATSAK
jgi:hypothetical protein